MESREIKPNFVSIGCPDDGTASIHDSILNYLKPALQNSKRAAVLLGDEMTDGILVGTYWPKPFPIDRSAIEAVQAVVEPRFMNDAGTVCCVALPPPYNEYLYVEANEGTPFDPLQLQILVTLASVAIGLHDVSAKNG